MLTDRLNQRGTDSNTLSRRFVHFLNVDIGLARAIGTDGITGLDAEVEDEVDGFGIALVLPLKLVVASAVPLHNGGVTDTFDDTEPLYGICESNSRDALYGNGGIDWQLLDSEADALVFIGDSWSSSTHSAVVVLPASVSLFRLSTPSCISITNWSFSDPSIFGYRLQ